MRKPFFLGRPGFVHNARLDGKVGRRTPPWNYQLQVHFYHLSEATSAPTHQLWHRTDAQRHKACEELQAQHALGTPQVFTEDIAIHCVWPGSCHHTGTEPRRRVYFVATDAVHVQVDVATAKKATHPLLKVDSPSLLFVVPSRNRHNAACPFSDKKIPVQSK